MTLAFLLCVERGRLESQAILLCRSIRRFGGAFAQAAIHAYSPRAGMQIPAETQAVLMDLGVELHDQELNREFHHYPISNKIFACAHAEAQLKDEILVFLDSDTILVGEPEAFRLPPDVDAAVRPVDRKNRGSKGTGDRHEPYWQTLYALLNIKSEPMVQTVVDGEAIRAYFNAGLIVVRRTAGIFASWQRDFLQLMAVDHVPPNGVLNNMDQFALAATLSRRFDRVQILDERYNYPLGKRPILPRSLGCRQLAELVHIHYHRWFHRPDFLRLTQPPLDPTDEVVRWLEPQLPLQPTIDDPVRYL